MSPLRKETNEGIQIFQDKDELNISEWERLLGVSSPTVRKCARETGIVIRTGEPLYKNGIPQSLIPISKIPQIVKHLQNTRRTAGGKHHYPSFLGANTSKKSFSFHPKGEPGTTLTFTRED